MSAQRIKLIIGLTVLIDVIGIGIVIPAMPFYVTSHGASAMTVTILFAVFALCSFLSTPVLGALSDRIGRRPVLIISILSTSLGWLVFANARSIVWLFAGRIIDGLAAGNFSTAQSVLVDIAQTDKERTQNLGIIGALFGIGFILGPLLGGVLTAFGLAVPFWFVAGVALVNAILAATMLPETNRHRSTGAINFNPFRPLIRAIQNRRLLPTYVSWTLFSTAAAGMHAIFALYLAQQFGFNAFITGLFLTGMGVLMALNQGVALKHFWLRRFNETMLELGMIVMLGVGFIILALGQLQLFIFGLILTTLSQSVLRVVTTSQVAGTVPPQERGEALGVLTSLASIGMIVGPLTAGALFVYHVSGPFILSAGWMACAFFIVQINRRTIARLPLSDDPSAGAIMSEM